MNFSLLAELKVENYLPQIMQANELLRYFRMPDLVDFRQYIRTVPPHTLVGFGAFAAFTTFWYATRPKPVKPPCDLSMQSVEVAVRGGTGQGLRLG